MTVKSCLPGTVLIFTNCPTVVINGPFKSPRCPDLGAKSHIS